MNWPQIATGVCLIWGIDLLSLPGQFWWNCLGCLFVALGVGIIFHKIEETK